MYVFVELLPVVLIVVGAVVNIVRFKETRVRVRILAVASIALTVYALMLTYNPIVRH